MATPSPSIQHAVIHPIEPADLIQFILEHHAEPSTLIVCSNQEEFLRELSASIDQQSQRTRDQENQDEDAAPNSPTDAQRPIELPLGSTKNMPKHQLLIPTLHQISQSQTLKIAYCASLESLRAYLSVYGLNQDRKASGSINSASKDSTYRLAGFPIHRQPLLALLNSVAIHRSTSSFSAQGLGRTFASAIEAAHRMNKRLLVAECPSVSEARPTGLEMSDDDRLEQEEARDDPWEEQVAILNVTTKSFGAGERGWVGRTVSVRQVVGRWCGFLRPSDVWIGMG